MKLWFDKYDVLDLKAMIEEHVAATKSLKGQMKITFSEVFRNSQEDYPATI